MKIHSIRLPLPKRSLFRQIALFTLLAVFCAHAFAFFNLTYSGESVMLNAANGFSAQIEGGQYLQAIYFKLRSGIASPLIVGLLSTLYLVLSLTLISDLLKLEHPLLQFSLCASVCAHPSLTAVFAERMHTADALFLAFLFVSLGIWLCRRLRYGFIPGAAFLCAALALESVAASITAGLILLTLCADLLNPSRDGNPAIYLIKACAAFASACAVYALGHLVMLRLTGLSSSAVLHLPETILDAWLYPLRMLFAPLTAYTHVSVLLRAVLLLAAAACLFLLPNMSVPRRVSLLAAILLLPLAINLPVYSTEAAGQVRLSYAMIDMLLLLIIQQSTRPRLHRAVCAAFAVLLLSGIVFSNQIYLKKNLEFEATLSRMTRIIDRAEDTPGFQPGLTPVAILGQLDAPSITQPLKGFEHLTVFEAAASSTPVTRQEDMIWYCWEILGYPFNFVSNYDHELLAQSAEVIAMPAFPDPACCQFIGDTLVIKISD